MEIGYRKTKKRVDETEDGLDLISCLPDSVLKHIQSFLPTEDVVKTSFLSKKWKSLWSPLSVLSLDMRQFCENSRLDNPMKRFFDFIDRMLVLHEGRHMKELRLSFNIDELGKDSPRVDSTITSDSTLLKLDFWGGRKQVPSPDYFGLNCNKLPQCSFPCKSVESLMLWHCRFEPRKYMHFSSVNRAYLSAVRAYGKSVHGFIAGCPCLEVLVLEECVGSNSVTVDVPESKLKRLDFVSCTGDKNKVYEFNIILPSLIHFKFEGFILHYFTLSKSKYLTRFELLFFNKLIFRDKENDMLRSLLAELDNVETMILSRSCLEVLNPSLDKTARAIVIGEGLLETLPPPLPNLKNLTLNLPMELGADDVMGLACLIRSSPYLEFLYINLTSHTMDDEIDHYFTEKFDFNAEHTWASELFPSDHLHRLRIIVINGFEGRNSDLELIDTFLKNAVVLEKMVIYKATMKSRYAAVKASGDKKKLKSLKAHQEKTIENLLALRRSSYDAELLIY